MTPRPRFDDPDPADRGPLAVAAFLRERADGEGWLAEFTEADTHAGTAMRALLWERQVAWAHAAALVELATHAHVRTRLWHVVRQLVYRAEQPGVGASGPVFRTAADLLARALDHDGWVEWE
jgi:hypothetical protein